MLRNNHVKNENQNYNIIIVPHDDHKRFYINHGNETVSLY